MYRLVCITVILFSLALPSLAQAGKTITLRHALISTWKTSPDLMSARASLQISQDDIDRALSGWRPNIGAFADVSNTQYNSSSTFGLNDGTQEVIGIEALQPVYRGGSTSASVDASKSFFEAARADLKLQEQETLLQATNSFMGVLEAIELKRLATINRDVLARERDASEQRYNLGDLTKTDLSQATARLARAKADLTGAQGELDNQRAIFEQITGVAIGKNDTFALPPDDVLLKILPKTLNEGVAMALDASPTVIKARENLRASEYEVRSTQGELLPQVDLRAGFDRTYDPIGFGQDDRDTQVIGLRASLPIYQSGDTRARIRQAKSNADRARAILSAQERLARRQVVQSWTALNAARAITIARKEEVAAQEIARQGVRKEAEVGSRTTLDVLNADQEYLDANVALVSARKIEIVARFALAASIGILPDPVQ